MTAIAEKRWRRDMRRSGYMKRYDPVGRMLDPLVQLAGGFLLYVREGACGGGPERWVAVFGATLVSIPISSTPDEARALLAAGVGDALGRQS